MDNSGNLTSIIIALLGLLTLVTATVIYVARWAIDTYSKDIKAHTNATNKMSNSSDNLTKAIKKNTESNDEVLSFMKNLNGKLAKATIQTIQEQKVTSNSCS